MKKDSFVLYTELIDTVDAMSDADAGALFKMILNYENDQQIDKDVDTQSHTALIAFTFVKRQLDRLDEKYEETIKARKEAGKKGAEKRWQKDGKTMANDSKGMANDSKAILSDSKGMAKMPVNVPVPVPVNDPVPDIHISPLYPPEGKKAKPEENLNEMLETTLISDVVKHQVKVWLDYKKEQHRFTYKPIGFKSFLTDIVNHVDELGDEKVCEAIVLSMGKGYKGITWELVTKNNTNAFMQSIKDRVSVVDSWV